MLDLRMISLLVTGLLAAQGPARSAPLKARDRFARIGSGLSPIGFAAAPLVAE